MKLKNSFFYTLREDPKEEDSLSGKLLVKAGFIKKTSSGVYSLMPLGFRVYKNIETIIREEMDKAGALELVMPALLPEDVYIKSGRRDNFGSDMFSLKDRMNRNYVLGPTHEELFVDAASMKIKSYKDMPFNIYQIQNKFRDEPRPRYGLIRTREFTMKDAYSFDTDLSGLDKSYEKMFEAYKKIFDRIGLDYKIVTADTGVMGGLLSEEFQAITDIGEDIVVLCDKCDFASNIEVCDAITDKEKINEEEKDKELILTQNVGTIEDLVNEGFDIAKLIKTLIYKVDGNYVLCVVPADREVNELKVKKHLNASLIELASSEEVIKITGANVGFAGPIGLNLKTLVDKDVVLMKNFLVGANKTDYHYMNVNLKDFDPYEVLDLKNVNEHDICPKCGGRLYFKHGIEVGNTFKLGDKYAKNMNLTYLDQDNNERYPYMGSYGIGLQRIMASVVEQKNDSKGIIWPVSIAPYKVGIVLLNSEGEEFANSLYNKLNDNNISVMLDDREERPGVKFNDMDLIGIPIRITIGRKYNDGIVELKLRENENVEEVDKNSVLEKVKDILNDFELL